MPGVLPFGRSVGNIELQDAVCLPMSIIFRKDGDYPAGFCHVSRVGPEPPLGEPVSERVRRIP
jgi:hypothetical protein